VQIIVDENTREIHLRGLDWGDLLLMRTALVDRIFNTHNDHVTARAIKIIEITDAAVDMLLGAGLGADNADGV
jgi:hypothetical protein